jgi:hypothetical protein
VRSVLFELLTNRFREAYFERMEVRTPFAVDNDHQNAKDLEIIDTYADDLNKEALDVLDYQVELEIV